MPDSRSISVVIPTYNRTAVLPRALDSVLGQTLAADQIVVVDDGSTDGTATMLAERYPEVTVVKQPNRGVSAARNRGVRSSNCNWIALLDSDDEWVPEKLEAQMAAIEAEPDHRLVHCDEIWVRNGVRVNQGKRHRKAGGSIFRECLPLCAISPSSALLHRSVFDDIGYFDESLPACEDYDYWLRYTARLPVSFVARPLVVKYGGHRDQLSSQVEALDRHRIRALVKLLNETVLGAEDRAAAVETLLTKIAIYRSGAEKRDRLDEALELEQLATRFAPGASDQGPDSNLSPMRGR